jgi:hypothetical protein
MNIPCNLVLKSCLPCNDDPIANLSAEAPDVDVFTGFNDYFGKPPVGTLYAQIGCKRICYSEVSQEEADECALLQAQECVWPTWQGPPDPPRPPGPGGDDDPPDDPPLPNRNPLPTFRNTEQCCTADCPDGQPFLKCQAGGTVGDLSQALANAKALSLACKKANQQKLCFVSTPPGGCVSQGYSSQLLVAGGTPFGLDHESGYIWVLVGSLPPGLDLDGGTGIISGTPLLAGSYLFEVDVFDAAGNFGSHVFTMCVGEITTTSLGDATIGASYSQGLTFEPTDVTDEEWTITSGDLPAGLSLSTAGVISGTPTAAGTALFTVQAAGTCFGAAISCLRSFSLEVISCTIGCVNQLTIPVAANDEWPHCTAYANNVGLIFGGAGDGITAGVIHVIDPILLAIVNIIILPAANSVQAMLYHPFTERLIAAAVGIAPGTIDLLVVNPTTLLLENAVAVAGNTPQMALDTQHNRVYMGTNSVPCALYSFDVVTQAATQVAVGASTLGAVAYSPDDDYIFGALDSNLVNIYEAETFLFLGSLAVVGGQPTNLAYCPTNRCLYASVFNLSLLRVWKLDNDFVTTTTVNFVIPATGLNVQIDVGTTSGMVVHRSITVDGALYTVISVDGPTQATIQNVTGTPGATVTSPASVQYQGILQLADIIMPENASGLVYDANFNRLIVGAFAFNGVRIVDPTTQSLECSILTAGMGPRFTTVGNSTCTAFIPTFSVPGTDNAYHAII